MKQLIYLLFFAFSIAKADFVWALSTDNDKKEIPSFTVNAIAEFEVLPNEIYISIAIIEEKNSDKLEETERKLLKALANLGIDGNSLAAKNTFSRYASVGWFQTDHLRTKNYRLTLTECCEVEAIFDVFEDLDIKNAFIEGFGHSQLTEFKQQVRIDAMKEAKNKATYMLKQVDAQPGKPLWVMEDYTRVHNTKPIHKTAGYAGEYSNTRSTISTKISGGSTVAFENIKITSSVQVKFPIE